MVTRAISGKSSIFGTESNFLTPDILVIFKIIVLNGLGLFFVEILFPFIISRIFKLSATFLGLVFTFIMIGNIISAPFAGFLADKYSKKRMVAIGSIGRGISYFLIYFGIIFLSPIIFYIGTFFLGILTGFFWIPLNSLISQKTHKYHRSEAFGRRDFALGFGQLIGGIFGLGTFAIGMKFFPTNYMISFSCIPIFGVANILAASIFMKQVDEKQCFNEDQENLPNGENREKNFQEKNIDLKPNVTSAEKTIIQRQFILGLTLFLFAFFISALNGSIAKPFYQLYILSELTTDPTIAMIIYVPTGLFGMILAPRLGKWADKFNPKIGLSIVSVCGATVTLILITFNSLWLFMFFLIFDVAINNTANLLLEQVFSRISKKHRGKTFGLRSTAANFGGLIGPILGGLAWDFIEIKTPFIISIFIELSLIPLFIIALRRLLVHLEEK